jgi:hypothetical protein
MNGMRKITEFKGYRSILGYDSETGQFVTVALPELDILPEQEQPEPQIAEIVPFPLPDLDECKKRMAG